MRNIRVGFKIFCCCLAFSALSNAHADLISGQVLGPDNKPAPNAQVWLQRFGGENSGEYEKLLLDANAKFQVEAQAASFSPIFFGRIFIFENGFAPGGGSLGKRDNVYRLQKAQSISGRVLDDKEKPIAGARVALNFIAFGDDPQTGQFVFVRDSPLAEKFVATTNESGEWTINAGGQNARISLVVSAPGFATQTLQNFSVQGAAIHLSAGAALSGRVVYENGKPAANIKVGAHSQSQYAANESWGEAFSGDDGTFRIEGLGPGAHNVYVATRNDAWVGDTGSAVAVAGQTVSISDLVLRTGVWIEGSVSDENGAPISGVEISAQGPQLSPIENGLYHTATSDAKGAYHLRVVPGKYQLNLASTPPQFIAPGKGSPYRNVSVVIGEGETKTVPFVLQRGLEIRGTLRDVKGAPVPGVLLSLQPITEENDYYDQGGWAYSEDDGRWQAVGLKAGKYQIKVSGEWKVVTPLEIEAPAAQSIAVKIEPQTYFTLRGRVQSPDGKPVAGAGVVFSVSVPEGRHSSASNRTVVSDETGWYEIPKLKGVETVRFVSASKPGFVYAKGGELLENADKASYATIVMSPMNAKLAGVVMDADKKPVAGARVVSPGAIPTVQTTTDANGHFVLENLAQGFVPILAIHPTKGAVVTRQISDGSDVELQLVPSAPAPAPDTLRGEEILQEASESGDGKKGRQAQIAYAMLPFDFEKATQLARDADGKIADFFIARAIAFLARRDPMQAATWGMAHGDEIENEWARLYAMVQLGLAVADENPALAQQLYQRVSATSPTENAPSGIHTLYRAMLAAKLKLPAASAMVDQALAEHRAAAQTNPGLPGYEAMVAEALAPSDIAQAQRVFATLSGDEKNQALHRVVGVLAKRGDKKNVAEALEFLNDYQKNAADESGFYFSIAATELVPALGKFDPAAALALARRVTNTNSKAQALALAAQAQTDDAGMGVLLREAGVAASNHQAPVAQLSQVAIIAFPQFPELARELTNQALRIYRENKNDKNGYSLISGTQDDAQNLGIALSLFDSAGAREFLELEWLDALEAAKSDQAGRYALPGIIRAMAFVDFERAMQMARALPPSQNQSANEKSESLIDLARWLMTSPAERPLLWSSFQPRNFED